MPKVPHRSLTLTWIKSMVWKNPELWLRSLGTTGAQKAEDQDEALFSHSFAPQVLTVRALVRSLQGEGLASPGNMCVMRKAVVAPRAVTQLTGGPTSLGVARNYSLQNAPPLLPSPILGPSGVLKWLQLI